MYMKRGRKEERRAGKTFICNEVHIKKGNNEMKNKSGRLKRNQKKTVKSTPSIGFKNSKKHRGRRKD